MSKTNKVVLTMMVDNEFGVLTRATALIRRWGGYLIAVAVSETEVLDVSRMTITLDCRHKILENILSRIKNLAGVREVSVFSPDTQVSRELALVRVLTRNQKELEAALCGYKTEMIESGESGFLFSLVCTGDTLDELIARLKILGAVDLARTGTIAITRLCEQTKEVPQ